MTQKYTSNACWTAYVIKAYNFEDSLLPLLSNPVKQHTKFIRNRILSKMHVGYSENYIMCFTIILILLKAKLFFKLLCRFENYKIFHNRIFQKAHLTNSLNICVIEMVKPPLMRALTWRQLQLVASAWVSFCLLLGSNSYGSISFGKHQPVLIGKK